MELGTSHESLRLLALLFTPVRRMQAGDLVSLGATARRASQSEEIIFFKFWKRPGTYSVFYGYRFSLSLVFMAYSS